jgi:hypothetical protein
MPSQAGYQQFTPSDIIRGTRVGAGGRDTFRPYIIQLIVNYLRHPM